MNWHVSCAITSDGKGKFFVSLYNHLFNSCSQDWYSVLSILESLLITVRSSHPKVKKAYLKSDEAGCYHNSQLIAAARDVGERVGVSLQRYDFSEPQSGKDVCDRILCPLKGAIRRFCNEGHDVLTASDMHTALKERPVRGCTAAVCLVNETKKDLDIKKLQQFSAMHDFSYQQDGLRVWKAFEIGPGKLIPWDTIYIKHQGATDLTTEQENFGFTPRVTHGSAHGNGDAESSCKLGQVLECPEPACARTFRSVEEMELHISVGQHTESVYDKLKRGWVEKFSSLTLSEDDSANAIERQCSEPFQPNLSEGWALHKPKGGAARFSENVRQYLTSKFDIGEQSGRKEDPRQVSQDMRKAKGENGERLFSRAEWLTKAQIQGFFSRLSSSRRRRAGPSPSTAVDDKSDEGLIDENEVNHMSTVESVITEIGLTHPIVYDIYDLCDYVKKEKLNHFTVSMLKEICTFFELPFKSRDSKALLMSKIKEMTHECQCSVEG